jgi:hypothetical protein
VADVAEVAAVQQRAALDANGHRPDRRVGPCDRCRELSPDGYLTQCGPYWYCSRCGAERTPTDTRR